MALTDVVVRLSRISRRLLSSELNPTTSLFMVKLYAVEELFSAIDTWPCPELTQGSFCYKLLI